MHNQSNNSKSRYPLTINQDFINHLTGIANRAQESSTDADIQFGAQNAATLYLNQQNSSYPRDNPISSSTNDGLFSSNNALPRGNNNTHNSGTLPKPSTIPSLNNSSFPNLNTNSRQQSDNFGIHHSTAFQAGRSYVSIVRKISEESTFKVCNKDFPELPTLSNNSIETTSMNNHQVVTKTPDNMGTMLTTENARKCIGKNDESKPDITNPGSANVTNQESCANNQKSYVTFLKTGTTPQEQPSNSLPGIEPKTEGNTFLPDEKIINIPAGVIQDQYGLLGQLIAMKLANTDPDLVYLNFGEDLTSLGLDLNSPENILPKFAGPFSNTDLQPHNAVPEPDFRVIDEYTNNLEMSNSLPKFNLSKYKEDLLFYLFYTQIQTDIQIKVGRELFYRDWRYHTEYHLWIAHGPGMKIFKKTDFFEHGTYYVFDVKLWKKVPRELFIDYSKLEYIDEVNEEDNDNEASSDTINDRSWIQDLGTKTIEF